MPKMALIGNSVQIKYVYQKILTKLKIEIIPQQNKRFWKQKDIYAVLYYLDQRLP